MAPNSPTALPDSADGTQINPHRLARNVLPVRYDIVLSPDLRQRTFVGSVDIVVSVADPTATIVLNSIELDLLQVWLVGDDGARNGASITLDEHNERATFTFERTVHPGTAKLHVEFTGILNDKLRGFYASTFQENGVEKVIGTTQMQSTDARRSFPCWDEPDCKAVFGLTLIVDEAHTALSNMHEISRSPMASGKQMVRFADTPVMSTYLLAFVIGELELTDPIDAGGVPVRIVARPGQMDKTAFALEVAKFALEYFQEWYGIPYPGSKLDMVATPDFAAGAMENLGLITYRETLLLTEEKTATAQDLQSIATVVAHEIAHMWFGDLVTMSWWNGIWLNEAFATFAEISCTAKFRPEWDKWTTFGVERAAASSVDGLHSTRPIEFPVGPPSEADAMFDVLTYEKGASVIRQLEQFLGEIPFRDGVRSYLKKHSYSNTETTDLFDSLEEVTGAPVRALMDSWIFQGGYPLVSASLDPASTAVTFAQQHFTYLPNPSGDPKIWSVPLIYRTVGTDGSTAEHKVLLDTASLTASVPAGTSYVVANSGGHGFYRVGYGDGLKTQLREQFGNLAPIERFLFTSDLWATVLQGSSSAEDFLVFTDSLAGERDLSVWRAVVEGWSELNAVFSDERRTNLQTRIQTVLRPIVAELGLDGAPGEALLVGQMRGLLLDALGKIGHDANTLRLAEERVAGVLDETTTLPPDVGAAVLRLAALRGDAARFDQYTAARAKTTSQQQNIRILRAMGGFPEEFTPRYLEMLLGPTVRSQDAPYALAMLLASRHAGALAWAFTRDNWDRLVEEFPGNSIARMVETAASLSDPATAAALHSFFGPGGKAGVRAPQAQKKFQQMLERLDVNVALREREAPSSSSD